jgi:hypothetical protein
MGRARTYDTEGFVLPTFAQQTNAPDQQLRQRPVALIQKHSDAMNNNDAAAIAALFTEDADLERGPAPAATPFPSDK